MTRSHTKTTAAVRRFPDRDRNALICAQRNGGKVVFWAEIMGNMEKAPKGQTVAAVH